MSDLVAELREGAAQGKTDAVPNVREMRYVVECAECKVKAQGTIEDFVQSGWVAKPAAQFGLVSETPLWFCAGCELGIKRA